MPKPISRQTHHTGDRVELDLRPFILAEDNPENHPFEFMAIMGDNRALQETLGLECTPAGLIHGTLKAKPADGKLESFQVLVVADAHGQASIIMHVDFDVLPAMEQAVEEDTAQNQLEEIEQIGTGLLSIDDVPLSEPEIIVPVSVSNQDKKYQIWQSIHENFSLPTTEQVTDRPITAGDIYYLLGRYATLTLWNADVLVPASQLKLLSLPGASEHFHVFDRGSSIVASPKNLYSSQHTLLHTIRTAQAMMREVFSRGWTVEAAGYDRMLKAAWLEGKRLAEMKGVDLKFLYYNPSQRTEKFYAEHIKPRINQAGGLPYGG